MSLNFLPFFIRRRFEHRPYVNKVIDNISWLVLEKAFRLSASFFVGVYIARYLGPDKFGLLSYVLTIFSFLSVFSKLGLYSIAVRDLSLVDSEKDRGALLSAISFLLLGGSLVTIILVYVSFFYFGAADDFVSHLVFVVSLSLVFNVSDVFRYAFESAVASKYVAFLDIFFVSLSAVVRVVFILFEAPVDFFVYVIVFESAIMSFGLMYVYKIKMGGFSYWNYSYETSKRMLREGFPLVASGLASVAYLKVDQIMIAEIMGERAVGIYTPAVKILESWTFVPMIIAASVFPSISLVFKNDRGLFFVRFQRLCDVCVLLSLVFSVFVSFFSADIIYFLYGDEYAEAGEVLAVIAWSAVLVPMNILSYRWLVLERAYRHILVKTTLGFLINLTLNFILIEKLGVLGAAIASIVSVLFVAYFYDMLFKKTRRFFYIKTLSLFFVFRVFLR